MVYKTGFDPLNRATFRNRKGGWRCALVMQVCCLASCLQPLPPASRDEVVTRETSELIVSGTVTKVRDSHLETILIDSRVWRQDVCMTVDHILKGPSLREVCFVQFTGDYSHSDKRPLPAVESGQQMLMFLSRRAGVWRPPVDLVRVWIELPCGSKCKDPLIETTLQGKMAELVLRFGSSSEYPVIKDIVPTFVRKAVKVADRQTVRRLLYSNLSGDDPELKAAICIELESMFEDSKCKEAEIK